MEAIGLTGIWELSPLAALIGVTVFLFMSLARGWVIPKSSHEREMANVNRRGDEWKETAHDQRRLISEQSSQITTLTEATRTPAEFFGTVMREGGAQRVVQKEESPNS